MRRTSAVEGVSAYGSASVYAAEGINTTNELTKTVNKTAGEAAGNPVKALTVRDAPVTRGKVLQVLAEQDDRSPRGRVKVDHVQNMGPGETSGEDFLRQNKVYRVD